MITADVPADLREWKQYCPRCKKQVKFIADRLKESDRVVLVIGKDSMGHEIGRFWKGK